MFHLAGWETARILCTVWLLQLHHLCTSSHFPAQIFFTMMNVKLSRKCLLLHVAAIAGMLLLHVVAALLNHKLSHSPWRLIAGLPQGVQDDCSYTCPIVVESQHERCKIVFIIFCLQQHYALFIKSHRVQGIVLLSLLFFSAKCPFSVQQIW